MTSYVGDCVQRRANRIARSHGYHRATHVVVGDTEDIISVTPSGYRKCTTGQYVPMAYIRKGWSSCYYQHLICVVSLIDPRKSFRVKEEE